MRLIVSDANIEGHVRALLNLLKRSEWYEALEILDVSLITFEALGLKEDADDRTVWRAVQARGAMLITNNRNKAKADSLQSTIDSENDLDKIPVITLSSSDRFLRDRAYAMRAAKRLIEIIIDWDENLGTGRLYIP